MTEESNQEEMEKHLDSPVSSPSQSCIPATPESDGEALRYIRDLNQDNVQPIHHPNDTPKGTSKEKRSLESKVNDELLVEVADIKAKYLKARRAKETRDTEYLEAWKNYKFFKSKAE